jgi:hypothetical protein
MIDTFISYSRSDRARAQRIGEKLKALGLEVWLDARIQSGTTFDAEIERALREAKSVLVLWSPAGVESEWVRNEAMIGKDRGVLVALMIASCELPVAFRSTQYEPLFAFGFADDHPSWIKAVERIKDLVGRRDEVDALQRKVLRRRKVFRSLSWLVAWPVVSILLLTAMIYLLAPLQPVRPDVYQFSGEQWEDGWVFAVGSIDLEGEQLPVNHVEISCRRDVGECLEVRAELRGRQLSALSDRRQIVRWDEQVIVATSQSACGEVVMTVDRALETVNMVRARRPNMENDVLCSWMNERNSYRLVDGYARAVADERVRGSYIGPALAAILLVWTVFVLFRIALAWRR